MTPLPHDLAARVVEGSPDAIVICDPQGVIRYWNHGAQTMLGYSRSDATGSSLDIIIPLRLRERHWAGWHAAVSAGVTQYAHGRLLAVPAVHKDGGTISIEFSMQLLKDPAGAVEWVVAIIRDVTPRYRRDKALREELAALKARLAGQQ